MENLLKKRLAIIKERAKRLKARHASGDDAMSRLQRFLGWPPPVWPRYLEPDKPPLPLELAVPGQARVIGDDPCYVVSVDGDDIDADAPRAARRLAEVTRDPSWARAFGVEGGGAVAADGVCFFDIETAGLSPATYVFLCGLMYVERDRFVVEQAFARDYAEERGILLYVKDKLARFPLIVTYNGLSFDVPFVKTRMAVGRIEFHDRFEHVDLLPHARRVFRRRLPNCRLETVERHLKGVSRVGDIPGREIPDAYHDFVRRGDARAIRHILYHNRMDLLAMALVLDHLARTAPPEIPWPRGTAGRGDSGG